jgi:hypothetical protein
MRVSALLVPAFVAVLAASACSNQGEGSVCDQNNGSNDCETGLTCVHAPGLSAGLVNSNRCCPTPPAQPTTAVCTFNTSSQLEAGTEVPDAFANGVPETGTAETGGPEASTPEAGTPDAAVPPAEAGALPDAASTDASPE